MVFYFVQRGETLYHIARRYQTTVHAIVHANRLEDPNAITPGQALMIPRPGEVPSPPPGGMVHLVRPGETVFYLARKFGTPVPEILKANQIAHPEFILPGQQLVIPELQLAGDEWPMSGRTAGRTGTSPIQLGGQPTLSWSCGPHRVPGFTASPPVIRYDRIYAGLGDGAYYCLEKSAGRVKWRWPVIGDVAGALPAPAVYDGLVYVGTPEGLVVGLDAYRGAQIWKTAAGAAVVGGPAVSDGLVYLAAASGTVYALESKTGALVWRRNLGSPVTFPVALGDGVVFVVDAAALLWALDGQNGEPVWAEPALTGTPAPPVFAELLVLVGGQALDPKTGKTLWVVPERVAPAVHAETLLYPGGAVDLFAGEYRWRSAGIAAGVAVAGAGNLLLVVTAEGDLLAVASDDGRQDWRLALGGRVFHAPAIAPGLLVATLEDGTVRAVKLKTERSSRGNDREQRERG